MTQEQLFGFEIQTKKPFKPNKPKQVVDEAHRMYLEGVSFSQIARQLSLSRQSISLWATNGGWLEQKKQLDTKDSQATINSVKELKERHIKISRLIQGKVIEGLQKGHVKLTVSDGLKAMEHEAKLMIPDYDLNSQTVVNADQAVVIRWGKPKIEGQNDK